MFAFETFALQVQQLDPKEYKAQTFSVNLGSLEEVREDNRTIQQDALVTSESAANLQDNLRDNEETGNAIASTTASLQLPDDLLDSCFDVNSNLTSTARPQRLSYSVFKSDVLFQNLNQSHLSIGSIIMAARLKCADNVTLMTSLINTFQIDRMVRTEDFAANGFLTQSIILFVGGRKVHRKCMCDVG